jgi:CheY-like chemotaxis protein
MKVRGAAVGAPGPSMTSAYHSCRESAGCCDFTPSCHLPLASTHLIDLTCTSTVCRPGPPVWTARMSVRPSPSRVSAAAQPHRASTEHTQCSPALLVIFVSAMFWRATATPGRAISSGRISTIPRRVSEAMKGSCGTGRSSGEISDHCRQIDCHPQGHRGFRYGGPRTNEGTDCGSKKIWIQRLAPAGKFIRKDDALCRTPPASRPQPGTHHLDLGLPDLDGLQIANVLRELSAAPVLIITARASASDLFEGMAAGASAYLIKPFLPSELRDAVSRLCPAVALRSLRSRHTPKRRPDTKCVDIEASSEHDDCPSPTGCDSSTVSRRPGRS